MKTIRKIAAFFLVVGFVFSLWTPVAVTAAPTQQKTLFYFGRSVLEKMDNGKALCYAYDKLVAGCKETSDFIDIAHRTHRITSDEAFFVYEIVMNDHPEFFWLADGMSAQSSGKVATAFIPRLHDGIAEERDALNARVAELTAGLEGKSDYETSWILHDRVCDAVAYLSSDYDQTAIGSLVYGASVCAGYARGYQILMQTMGIPVYVVTGTSQGQGHSWNLVQLDGEWYYTDVTWDDKTEHGGNIYYAYLNLTYDRMDEDHDADFIHEYLPRSTATAANYHIRNGTTMEQPDTHTIAALYRSGAPIRVYATGDMNRFFQTLSQRMGDIVNAVACPYAGYSCQMSYIGREIILQLSVSKPHTFQDHGNTCTSCGYTYVAEHHYVVTVVAPTCGTDGKTIYTCTLCGDSYSENIPATGEHIYDNDADATCNDCGYERKIAIPGDTDGNGQVTNRDLGLLQRYLNGWENVNVDLSACDVDGNGEVTNRDLGLLQRKINGWNIG